MIAGFRLAALALAALPLLARAQDPAVRSPWDARAIPLFRHLLVPRDLPIAASVVAQDKIGMIWIGTQDGLVRWDGYRPLIFRHDDGDPTSLPANFVTGLSVDGSGSLFVATVNGAVAKYDPGHERFASLPPVATGTGAYSAFLSGGAGRLWFGNSNGLSMFDEATAAWKTVELPPGSEVWSLLRARDGSLWVGTNRGLLHRAKGAGTFDQVALPESDRLRTGLTNIRALFQSADGNIWFGTNDGVIGVLDGAGGLRLADPVLPASPVHGIGELSPGVLCVATAGAGLDLIDEASGRLIQRVRFDPGRPSGLGGNLIFSEFFDRSGGLWIGHQNGADYLPPGNGAFLSLLPSDRDPKAFSGSNVSAISAREDGEVWIGTERGVDLLSPSAGRLAGPLWKADGTRLPASLIYGFATTGDGRIWIATGQGLFDIDHGRLKRFAPLADDPVRSLRAEGESLWIGTERSGLLRLDLRDDRLTAFNHRPDDARSISDNWIYDMARDPARGLWLATAHGLDLFDGEGFRHFLQDPSDPHSLPAQTILTLLVDRRGRVWADTQGGGIAVLSPSAREGGPPWFRHVGKAEGLTSDNVGKLLEDRQGRIWASTDSGLSMVDPDTLRARNFGTADGVAIPAFWSGSGARTPDGTLLFGGTGGIAIVHPDRLADRTDRPPVVATAIRVGGRAMPARRSLILPPGDHSLQVEFAALDYRAPERDRYAYRLEGFDEDWVRTDADHRVAAYTNLAPGSYRLLLRASNRKGVWTDPPAAIAVRVLPAWHQTIWFRTGVFMAGIGLIGVFVRSRTALLRRRQRELEGQISERTAEIASLLDNSGEGFLSFGPDLVIDRRCSRACEAFLGESPAGRNAADLLFAENPRQAAFVAESVPAALRATDPHKRELILSLLPKEIDRRGRRLRLHYAVIENGHLMAVLRDVTTERRLAERIASEHRRLEMIVAAVTDGRDFFEAVSAFRTFVATELPAMMAPTSDPQSALKTIYRAVHTFKGVFNQFSLERTPSALNAIEERLEELQRAESAEAADIAAIFGQIDLLDRLEQDLTIVRQALGDDFLTKGGQVGMTPGQASRLRRLVADLRRGKPVEPGAPEVRELLDEIERIGAVSLAAELAGHDRTIAQVARRLGKEVAPLAVTGRTDVWLDPDVHGPFLRSLIHVFRNCVSHGIEPPEIRAAHGKEEQGVISCHIDLDDDRLELAVSDDGAGVDLPSLRRQLVEGGLVSPDAIERLSDEEILDFIFLDRVSTAALPNDWAGRGVGLAAVRQEVAKLGGSVSIETRRGWGTRFLFTLPPPHRLPPEVA